MGVHILSILGTSLYEPVVYHGEADNEIESDFIQCAIVNEFREEISNGGKVTVFVTKKSDKDNWQDRIYTEREEKEFSKKWISDKKEHVICGQTKKGLKTSLEELFPELRDKIECIFIPDMKTEGEIWEVFNKIYSAIDENDDIVFDITHSFRSIPMLAVTVINYAKVMKNCNLKGVYYGAYEAGEIVENKKKAPIINLTAFNEILEWTYAADSFMKYGNVGKMKQVYADKMKKLPNEDKRAWSPIKKIIEDMNDITLGISTCRGADSIKLSGNKQNSKKSVKQAYLKLKNNIEKINQEEGKEIVPMTNLLQHVSESFTSFDKEKDYEVGCEIVNWCIKNHMIQQGYTALEETIKTYICEVYDLDDIEEKTRDKIVGTVLTGYSKAKIKGVCDKKELFEYLTKEDMHFSKTYSKLDENQKNIAEKMIKELPDKIFVLSGSVKDFRNDINHMGFRDNPKDSNKLEKELEEFYNEFCKIIAEFNAEKGIE